MVKTKIIRVPADRQVASAATLGAAALLNGQLVAFATETVYGIAALAAHSGAIRRLRELKHRPSRPFTVHMGNPDELGKYVAKVPAAARRLIDRTWPGPVTLLLPTGGKLADPKLNKAGLHKLLCSQGVIGLRCPDSPVAQTMLSAVAQPVVAPSANPVGSPSARNGEEVLATLNGKIDLLIDSGPTRYGKDSTIVRVDGGRWEVVREGVIDTATLAEIMKIQILFVCAGNTCRSPMAVGLAKAFLAQQLNCSTDKLEDRGWALASAGVAATQSGAATPEAVHAAKVLGADISDHRSRPLTKELITQADMIFCMTDGQVDVVREMAPSAADKVRRLDVSGPIADPIGAGPDIYRKVADRIRVAVRKKLKESLK